jgi:hypothetical protein
MTEVASAATPRTYGNWRRERGFGIGQLGAAQTGAVFAAVFVPVAVSYVYPALLLGLIPLSLLVLVAVFARVGGQTLADVVVRRIRFARARSAGWLEWSGGVLTDHPRGADLPGPMAPMVALEVDDGRGGHQGLLWDRRTGRLTVVFRLSPVGLDLVDPDQTDQWVANLGAWYASLGFQPMICHVAVTVDSAPSGGTTLRDYLAERIDPAAPATARQVMAELAAAAPAISAEVDTRVAVTFDPAAAAPRPSDLLGAVAEVVHLLPGLEAGLSSVGVGVLGRASMEWLMARLRMAYDPSSRGEVVRALRRGQLGHHSSYHSGAADTGDDIVQWWADAGPVRAQERWDRWVHDSGVTVSWALAEAPRQAVMAHVLAPLLAPGPFPRRVTLLYTPYPASEAADQVEAEISNNAVRAGFAARTKRDATQRERDDQARAYQAAREEAEGAGVGKFTLYCSTTITSDTTDTDELLGAAIADVEQRAGAAKLRLRRLRGAQSLGFAAGLGLGIDPVELARRGHR